MRVAEGFSMRWDEMSDRIRKGNGDTNQGDSTIVIGFSNPEEVRRNDIFDRWGDVCQVHEAIDVYMSLKGKASEETRKKHDEDVDVIMKMFKDEGWENYNWVEEPHKVLLSDGNVQPSGKSAC